HPNVVAIHRVGEVRQRPYLVSEYVQGTPLAALTKPIPWERALKIAIGLARGLGAAHRRGVLHRDIKPANVMLGENEDEAKLLDFGLAKLVGASNASSSSDSASASDSRQVRTSVRVHDAHATMSMAASTGDVAVHHRREA